MTCTWRGGQRQWAFRGDVEADAVARVGRIDVTVPAEPGDLLLGIALTGRDADDRPVHATRRAGAGSRSTSEVAGSSGRLAAR